MNSAQSNSAEKENKVLQNLNISNEKQKFMSSFLDKIKKSKNKQEGMALFKTQIKEAREAGISFDNADILLLASQLEQISSPKEKELIHKILKTYEIH